MRNSCIKSCGNYRLGNSRYSWQPSLHDSMDKSVGQPLDHSKPNDQVIPGHSHASLAFNLQGTFYALIAILGLDSQLPVPFPDSNFTEYLTLTLLATKMDIQTVAVAMFRSA